MQRRKTQRRFTGKREGKPLRLPHAATLVALALLLGMGIGSFLSSFPASANTPTPAPTWPDVVTAAPSSLPEESSMPEETAGPEEEPSESPSESPSEAPSETPAPDGAPQAAPANPMAGGEIPEIQVEEPDRGLLYGVKVGIDPGHQAHANSAQEPVAPGSAETKAKVSSGTQGVKTRIPEYEINLQIALLLRRALEAQGAQVLMTREIDDVDISNVERATMMNEWGADIVLRLHCNGSEDRTAAGIGMYVKSSGEGAAESYAVSEVLLAAMSEATGAHAEPIHVRDTYSGLNWSTVPSILLEMGYQSNPEEDELLASPEYQALLVEGMVQGLTNYFAEHPVAAPELTPEPTEEPTAEPTAEPTIEPATEDGRTPSESPEPTAAA